MKRTCFISFKTEDIQYKEIIQNDLKIEMIDKSLNESIVSENEDYIMQRIREDYLSHSTVTIHLIGAYSAENLGQEEQKYIKRELQASLYDGVNNTKNGILGIVLPEIYDDVYTGNGVCSTCGETLNYVSINDRTAIREFSYNYHIPNGKCHWTEEDRYGVLVKWDDFVADSKKYIEQAFEKRTAPIAKKTKVYP
ncbi:TIR domain-containing protein [Dokdonia sp.]|uniref:TIR domain-containing protein n=1 Tax=Dokdonia sp. TaxID=2024995 RepID=UPI0032654A12